MWSLAFGAGSKLVRLDWLKWLFSSTGRRSMDRLSDRQNGDEVPQLHTMIGIVCHPAIAIASVALSASITSIKRAIKPMSDASSCQYSSVSPNRSVNLPVCQVGWSVSAWDPVISDLRLAIRTVDAE